MNFKREVPSLVDLCIRTAIDNLRYMSDVGELDLHLLKKILAHCTLEQLAHIENSTKERDLSPVTDSLWKKFYEIQFGVESANLATKRMKQKQVYFKWKQLFEAKTKEQEEAQNRIGEKLKQRYAETLAKKQSRQIKICSKVPPSSNKRGWGGIGSSSYSSYKSPLMKKARMEFLNSPEAKVQKILKNSALREKSFPPKSIPRPTKPGARRL